MEQNPIDKGIEISVVKRVRPQNKHLKPFKKGETAPGGGRPKGQRDYATIYREAMLILADRKKSTPEKLEAEMVANGAILARKGNYAFYKDVLDRLHGAPTENVHIDIEKQSKVKDAIKGILS